MTRTFNWEFSLQALKATNSLCSVDGHGGLYVNGPMSDQMSMFDYLIFDWAGADEICSQKWMERGRKRNETAQGHPERHVWASFTPAVFSSDSQKVQSSGVRTHLESAKEPNKPIQTQPFVCKHDVEREWTQLLIHERERTSCFCISALLLLVVRVHVGESPNEQLLSVWKQMNMWNLSWSTPIPISTKSVELYIDAKARWGMSLLHSQD